MPNLLTTAALFAGFYSIVVTFKNHFDIAAIAIFIAMIADSLDGRIARLTNTQTAFGAEYDSLSDMVCFGVAPALLAFNWGLSALGNIGWLIAFIYAAATALRLARFNTQINALDKRYFQGLPSPAGAALVVSYVWVMADNNLSPSPLLVILLALFVLSSATLMVSRIRFNSFKQFNWQGRVPFVSLLIIVLIIAFVFWDPPEILFILSIIFGFSGPVLTLRHLRKRRRHRKLKT